MVWSGIALKPGTPASKPKKKVSFCGSRTYRLSTRLIKPSTSESRHKLQSTVSGRRLRWRYHRRPQGIILQRHITFHQHSTSTCPSSCTKTAIDKRYCQPPFLTDDLMDLLHLCLTSTYFTYNYKERLWDPLFPLLWLKSYQEKR